MLDWLQSDAAYWTISIALLAVGSLLLLRGVIGRRSRGRPLCRKCDYDLSGGVSATGTPGTPGINLTCPECGRTHKSARRLFHSRRFWKRAALGLCTAMLGAYALFWPGITQRRERLDEKWYLAVVPTTAWIWLVPYLDEKQIDLLDRRFYGDEWRRAVNAGGSGGVDSDGKQVFFEMFETRSPRLIPYLAEWQKRLLARRCVVALDEPIPPREVLESGDPAVGEAMYRQAYRRELACNWLGGVSDVDADAWPALIGVIEGSIVLGGERAVAVEAFQLRVDPRERDFALMIAALRDEDHEVRERAADTLGAWRRAEPAAVAALIALIREKREGVYALAKLRPVSDEMIEALHADLLDVRASLEHAIVGLGDAAVPRLIESLVSIPATDAENPDSTADDHESQVRFALAELGEPALPALILLLDHTDARIVRRAVNTLQLIGKRGAAAIPALRRMLERTTDENERRDIEAAIKDLIEGSVFDQIW